MYRKNILFHNIDIDKILTTFIYVAIMKKITYF
ncbi:hypothetical protein FNP_1445 [Fusobacterium polymorphum ATCC 10953]|uniref:Uncharacterized protein n=1 Tax=Fusobacterium polymorphum ATCC 10953 TaxID=393480 RepID=A5TWF2_FUSNP|nr:hypothetical protein FNP_1445 [Fusobacterium polymorphum ATCC 10953]